MSQPAPPQAAMTRPRDTLLVVDDVQMNIDVLVDALKNEHGLLVARDGPRALELARGNGPDLILLDVMMPDMDGFEVCRRLKADPLTRDIPVIFLSGNDEITNKTEGFACGGVDFVAKPFDTLEVLARVRTQLALMRARRALQRQNQTLEERVRDRTEEVRRVQRARYRSLNNLADAVAHQIRNPVVAIGGLARVLLRKHGPDDAAHEYLASILDEAMRLELVVRAVSEYTELTVQEARDVDVGAAVERARKRAMAAREHGRVRWDVQVEPWTLRGDRDVLVRGLFELLVNSLEALSVSGGAVTVTGRRTETGYVLTVEDDGPGIAPENLPYVHDPFFTTKAVGVGMGLAMAVRAAEEHEGVLRMESRPGLHTRAIMEFREVRR